MSLAFHVISFNRLMYVISLQQSVALKGNFHVTLNDHSYVCKILVIFDAKIKVKNFTSAAVDDGK